MSLIKFSSKVLNHFKNILKESNHKSILIGVKGGGCNGLKYYIEPTSDDPAKIDEKINVDNVNIIICGRSLLHLIGSNVEWKDDLMGSGLIFENPNAVSKCGCGETFNIG